MQYITKLQAALKSAFQLHSQRLTAIAYFISAAIKTKSIDTGQLALAMNKNVQLKSNQKRLKRLCKEVSLNPMKLLNQNKQVSLSLDRTEWDYGHLTNNLLTVAAQFQKCAIPIQVTDLGKCGSSNNAERCKAIKEIVKIVSPENIEVLTADREFASREFIATLFEQQVNFAIRIKADALITHNGETKPASEWFRAYQRKRLRGASVYGASLNICGRRLLRKHPSKEEYLVVVTNLEPDRGLELYKARWCIETMFGVLKSRGFNLEDTKFSISVRLENLVLLIGVAVLWALQVGLWVVEKQGQETRADGTPIRSLFRCGFDFLRRLFLTHESDNHVWDNAIGVLSPT
jgi:transposase